MGYSESGVDAALSAIDEGGSAASFAASVEARIYFAEVLWESLLLLLMLGFKSYAWSLLSFSPSFGFLSYFGWSLHPHSFIAEEKLLVAFGVCWHHFIESQANVWVVMVSNIVETNGYSFFMEIPFYCVGRVEIPKDPQLQK